MVSCIKTVVFEGWTVSYHALKLLFLRDVQYGIMH